MINIKDLAQQMQSTLCDKHELQFRNVTPKDIERILLYYNKIILKILKKGGFITLPIYRFKRREMCIRIAPLKRKIIKRATYEGRIRHEMIKKSLD